jgi:hypothetical protein
VLFDFQLAWGNYKAAAAAMLSHARRLRAAGEAGRKQQRAGSMQETVDEVIAAYGELVVGVVWFSLGLNMQIRLGSKHFSLNQTLGFTQPWLLASTHTCTVLLFSFLHSCSCQHCSAAAAGAIRRLAGPRPTSAG